jgi:hypothetical protein
MQHQPPSKCRQRPLNSLKFGDMANIQQAIHVGRYRTALLQSLLKMKLPDGLVIGLYADGVAPIYFSITWFRREMNMGTEFAKELETYNAHKADLLKDASKFVLVHGDQLAGVYDTYADALREGYKLFQLKRFMVKQIQHTFFAIQ